MKAINPRLILFVIISSIVLSGDSHADQTSRRNGSLNAVVEGMSFFELRADVNLNGNIRIASDQTGDVKATYTLEARAGTSSEATRFLDLIDFKLDSNRPNKVILEVLAPSHVPWGGSEYSVNLDLLVEIPEKISIKGDCRFMNLEIIGPFENVNLDCTSSAITLSRIFGSVRLATTNSDINIKTVKGDLRAETSNGKISVEDLSLSSGYAFLETTNGAITLDGIQGSIEAYTTYSPITAKNIDASEGSVVLRTSYANIEASYITGEIILETNYQPVNIERSSVNHGYSKIETSYAPIKAEFDEVENCDVYISSDYNNVELKLPETVSTRLVASVDLGGRIHTKDLSIKPVSLEPTRLEGLLGNGDSRIEVKVNGVGNIDIFGRQ